MLSYQYSSISHQPGKYNCFLRKQKSCREAAAALLQSENVQQEAADRLGTILDTIRRMEGSLSYALLMACLGLCVVLVCILLYVF